jgi:hypothetical protein
MSNEEALESYELQEIARKAEERRLITKASSPKTDFDRDGLVSGLRGRRREHRRNNGTS